MVTTCLDTLTPGTSSSFPQVRCKTCLQMDASPNSRQVDLCCSLCNKLCCDLCCCSAKEEFHQKAERTSSSPTARPETGSLCPRAYQRRPPRICRRGRGEWSSRVRTGRELLCCRSDLTSRLSSQIKFENLRSEERDDQYLFGHRASWQAGGGGGSQRWNQEAMAVESRELSLGQVESYPRQDGGGGGDGGAAGAAGAGVGNLRQGSVGAEGDFRGRVAGPDGSSAGGAEATGGGGGGGGGGGFSRSPPPSDRRRSFTPEAAPAQPPSSSKQLPFSSPPAKAEVRPGPSSIPASPSSKVENRRGSTELASKQPRAVSSQIAQRAQSFGQLLVPVSSQADQEVKTLQLQLDQLDVSQQRQADTSPRPSTQVPTAAPAPALPPAPPLLLHPLSQHLLLPSLRSPNAVDARKWRRLQRHPSKQHHSRSRRPPLPSAGPSACSSTRRRRRRRERRTRMSCRYRRGGEGS
eukprot:764340-Hanusia_phi.AAC.4